MTELKPCPFCGGEADNMRTHVQDIPVFDFAPTER